MLDVKQKFYRKKIQNLCKHNDHINPTELKFSNRIQKDFYLINFYFKFFV